MPANISGRFVFPNTTGAAPGYVQFDLENTGGNYPEVSGAAISPRQKFALNPDGTWSGTIYRNDEIAVNGSYSTWWHVSYYTNNLQVGPAQDYYINTASATIGGIGGLAPITQYPALPPPAQPLVGAASFLASFPLAATTWTATHNMGTQSVVVQCYDASFSQIIPDSVQNVSVNQTVATFLQPQAGYMVVFNVGNWTPSVSNPNYIIGNPSSSQGITGDYPFTLGGSLAAKRIEGVRYADQFAGADIGAKINAAIADLGSGGGTVVIPSGSYSFSSPVVFTANSVWIKGANIGATKLVFTGTGSAIKGQGQNIVISDLTVDGTGSTAAVGIELVSAYDSVIRNVDVSNISVGVKLNGGGPFGLNVVLLEQVSAKDVTTTGIWLTGTGVATQGCFNVVLLNCGVYRNTGNVTTTTGILVDSKSQNNQIFCPLINNCTTGIHFTTDEVINNVIRDPSLQACVTGILLESGSNTVEAPYMFANTTNITDTGADNNYINNGYGPMFSTIHFPFKVSPFVGGSPESYWSIDGSINLDSQLWTGTGTNFYPFRINRNGAALQFLSGSAGTIGGTQVFDSTPTLTVTRGAAQDVQVHNGLSVAGGEATDTLTVGTGTTLSRYARYTPTISPSSVAANTTAEQTFTNVLTSGDIVVGVSKPTAQAGLGIVGWRASGTSLLITFANNTASPITPTASEAYQVIAVQ